MNAPDARAAATIHTCWGCGQLVVAPRYQRTPHQCATTPREPDPAPEWQDAALGACVGRDPEMWFMEDDPLATEHAVGICQSECPVRAWCAAEGHRLRAVGVWGGTTTEERVTEARRAAQVVA